MKVITIDTTKNGYPRFLDKKYDRNFIECQVELKEDIIWEGRIISISTNGKYKVELLKQIKI